MSGGFQLHPEAYTDIDELCELISEDGPGAAVALRDKINAAIEALVRFPHQGHRRPDLTSLPLHFWRVYDFLIAYASDEQPLWVVAVIQGHPSPRVAAALLRGGENNV